MTGWRHTRTARLWLDVPVEGDLDDLHEIHADPATWRHLPSGRHTEHDQSERMLAAGLVDWERSGLGYWSVREVAGGPVVGRAGCVHRPERPWWNLYYRLAPAVQGRGYAAEVAARALQAAHDVAPDRPVVAFLLAHNTGSLRTAQGAGLREIRRGPDRDNPDPHAVRLVLADRPPTPALLAVVEREFGGPGAS